MLIVEDEAPLREAISETLDSAGFTVQAYPDGRDFAERVTAFRPDAAILDVMLPDVSGLGLAGYLRSHSDTAVLFVTARDGLDDRLAGFEHGADDYLVKPFVLAELIARLRAVLRRAGRLTSPVIEVGGLLIDEDGGEVLRGGEPVALTATELRLLCYLARNRNRVLSKTQILTQVWGYDEYDPNLVETFVSSLRRKLGDPRLIHTVRGIGYRLSAR